VKKLAKFVKVMGWQVDVFDPMATRERFPEADSVSTELNVDALTIRPISFAVIATQGHDDEAALAVAACRSSRSSRAKRNMTVASNICARRAWATNRLRASNRPLVSTGYLEETMALKIKGNVTVDAPRDVVWNLLFDTQFLQQVIGKIPGITVEKIAQVSDDKYEAVATMGVAMVKGKYDGTISILEKRPTEFVKFHGEGKGGGNWTSGDMGLTLAQQDGKTIMTYDGSGNVSGALASVGQRLIDTVGKQFIQHGTKAFAEEIAARMHEKQGAPIGPAAAPKSN
jgi:uncharacterized protein